MIGQTLINPFNNIRLSYLDDLENDPEVMENIVINSPDEILGKWIPISRPRSIGDWPESIQNKPKRYADPQRNADFDVKSFVSIWSKREIDFEQGGDFSFNSSSIDFFYNEEFDCLVFIGGEPRRPLEEIKKVLVVAYLNLKDELPSNRERLASTSISFKTIEEIYNGWINV